MTLVFKKLKIFNQRPAVNILLGMLFKLALISGFCDVGNQKMSYFDMTNVSSSVLTCFILQASDKISS
jgi:hypothetical protein